ncbi:protein phosphatase-5 [Ramicandelaber brevisporus]|nr:protein phosphatase-5 [Ramicandelaber brevisporus]
MSNTSVDPALPPSPQKDPATAVANGDSQKQKQRAEELKDLGNEQFKLKHFEKAIEHYSASLELDPESPVVLCNRAFAYIKTEAYGAALIDANKAIEINGNFTKAYYRRAAAKIALHQFKPALADYRAVVRRVPNDKDAQIKLAECEKIVRKMDFEKAIAGDDISSTGGIMPKKKRPSYKIDISGLSVEDSYDGPRLPKRKYFITDEFVREMMKWFKDEKKLHKRYATIIILAAIRYMEELGSVVDSSIPEANKGRLTVCGDVHGQYYDLLNIFEENGYPSESNLYLFNGDFVDRGSFSIEVILTLYAYKWLYPNSMLLNRGNHETTNMNEVYGFKGEALYKYSELVWKLFEESFNALPLGHVLQEKILVVHGGLFSDPAVSLQHLRKVNRFRQPPSSVDLDRVMTEVLWSDPKLGKNPRGIDPNPRGVGVEFGQDVTKRFLRRSGLECIIRSHQVKDEGYEVVHEGKCVTVFSAPNYCDASGNLGAYITVKPDCTLEYHTFKASPHPNVPPMRYASQFSRMGLW